MLVHPCAPRGLNKPYGQDGRYPDTTRRSAAGSIQPGAVNNGRLVYRSRCSPHVQGSSTRLTSRGSSKNSDDTIAPCCVRPAGQRQEAHQGNTTQRRAHGRGGSGRPKPLGVTRVDAQLAVEAMSKGRPRSAYDIMIAATAAVTDRILLTTDSSARFGQLTGVRAEFSEHQCNE